MLTVRILVADAHPVARRSICLFLLQDATLQVVGEATDGEEAVKKAGELQPDLVILDISLPGMTGIEAASQIRVVSPQTKIVFLSQHDSIEVAAAALKAGGHGYVVKSAAASELLSAIRTVREGITPFMSQQIIEQGWTPDW